MADNTRPLSLRAMAQRFLNVVDVAEGTKFETLIERCFDIFLEEVEGLLRRAGQKPKTAEQLFQEEKQMEQLAMSPEEVEKFRQMVGGKKKP